MMLWNHWWTLVCQLRSTCARNRTFLWMALCLAGMTTRKELLGVTSTVRALGLEPACYDRLLDFFHSPALDLSKLTRIWCALVFRLNPGILRVNGRAVLGRDGIKVVKAGGKTQRPLGIPAIRDRAAQTAAVLVLEPIFETDLQPEQYAYRRDRSALDAVRHVHRLINTGHREVVDADLSSYFDEIPHAELLKSVARRVVDGAMLHLIKMWLEAPVEETNDKGNTHRSTRNRDQGRGTPQGSPISPMLSNIYMRRFVLGWKLLGHEKRLKAYIVNYADDLVICCRSGAEQALAVMRNMMLKLKLAVNESKTRVCTLPEEPFDFLGYTMRRCYSPKTGRAYLGTVPSKKRVKRLCLAVSEITGRHSTQQDVATMVGTLNRKLIGWSNYFCCGPVSNAYRAVDRHTVRRLRQWLRTKHKVQGQGTRRFSDELLYSQFGLVRLKLRTASRPCATP